MTPNQLESARRNAALASAAHAANAQGRLQDLIEDAEWILEDASPELAMGRLGYTNPGSLAKRLGRAGRKDLAQPFWRLQWHTRPQLRA